MLVLKVTEQSYALPRVQLAKSHSVRCLLSVSMMLLHHQHHLTMCDVMDRRLNDQLVEG